MAVDAPMDTIAEEDTTSNEDSEHNPAEHRDSADNIKLQRVTGMSLRHTKQPAASVMKEGWMVHYTNNSTVVSCYFRDRGNTSLGFCFFIGMSRPVLTT